MRYKFIEDWKSEPKLARELNGLLAVLEVCDHDIMGICDKLAYRKYKNAEWESMIRNHFRIRLDTSNLSKDLCTAISSNKDLAKAIYRFDRDELVRLFELTKLPKNYNNVVFLINEHSIKDAVIMDLTPEVIKRRYLRAFPQE